MSAVDPLPNAFVSDSLYETREVARIVSAAKNLFLSRGIAAVSMLDIAHFAQLPELAVRQRFPTLGPLVQAVVNSLIAHTRTEVGAHFGAYTTAVEEMLSLRNWVGTTQQANSGQFFQELEANYPAAWQAWYEFMTSFPLENMRGNLQRGIQQGLYKADLDVEAFLEEMRRPDAKQEHVPADKLEELNRARFNEILARLVTPAGALVARRLQEGAPYY